MSRSSSLAPLFLSFFATACASSAPPPASPPSTVTVSPTPETKPGQSTLGHLDLPVTGSPECQRLVRDGMLALHSFLYDQAHESFAAGLAADPGCAMAAWGDAMTFDHPIWYERDLPKARAALARVSHEEKLTAKERAYLSVARALFTKDAADDAHKDWLVAAAAMHAAYPDDDEVTLQHALALLAVYGYQPAHVREQMESGSLALSVLARRPEHPGAAHYVIHAMDSREHAILALPAARTYARIAPASGHAQHMPSHTFTHLGMWRDVVPSNERAYASSVAWEKSRGHTASKYDWHSYSWLVAARLELGQVGAARKLIDEARALLVSMKDDSGDFRHDYANMVADYVTQTDRWDELEALSAPVFAPALGEGNGGDGPVACADHAPGGRAEVRMPSALIARMTLSVMRAEAAIREGDRARAEKRVAELAAVRAQTAAWGKVMPPTFAKRWEAIDEQLLARARAGKKPASAEHDKAVAALERALETEATQQPSGPAWRRTTRETLGEWLLANGKPKEALAAFERELSARPNRAVSLLGAARSAKAAGDAKRAREHYSTLAELWREADAGVTALAEVKAGATP
jgi:tetratricopeptide (TPR) repeat protein